VSAGNNGGIVLDWVGNSGYIGGDRQSSNGGATQGQPIQLACGPACPAIVITGAVLAAGEAAAIAAQSKSGVIDRIIERVSSLFGPSDPLIMVQHFTNGFGMDTIVASGNLLKAGSYVTLPGEVQGMNALQVEEVLEIDPHRGDWSTTFETRQSNLGPAPNGPTTSGGAIQFILNAPTPAGPWTPTSQ